MTDKGGHMDWMVIWTGIGVVITLGSLIIGGFRSLRKELHSIDHRLTVVETILAMIRPAFTIEIPKKGK